MTERTGGGMMQQKESAARQALRKKRARKRAIRLAGAAALAAALGQLGCRVLLADLDPQGNATSGVGINKREVKVSSYHVLMEESGAW